MDMVIPSDFQFSQASLQDFQDCRQRFYFRYIQRLSWPALEAEPAVLNEEWMQQGAEFHRIVHQYFLGMPAEKLSITVTRENLRTWWKDFLTNLPVDLSNTVFPERMLATKLAGFNLIAKFDLVELTTENSMVIYDWKTSQHSGSRQYLSGRMQTKVYPYVLAKVGHVFTTGKGVSPENIKMVYWYACNPQEPETFSYNRNKMVEDEQILIHMIDEITSLEGSKDFPKTENRKQCQFCVYRSLCNRGEKAGDFSELEIEKTDEIANKIDFDQIQEIEF
jgi:RecB family exonuclease